MGTTSSAYLTHSANKILDTLSLERELAISKKPTGGSLVFAAQLASREERGLP